MIFYSLKTDYLYLTDEEEIKKRITLYKGCARDRSRDTLHGVFLDIAIASRDPFICDYSRKKMEQSMAIAQELGVKGVVFHSGLIGGLNQEEYLRHWYETQEALWDEMLTKYTKTASEKFDISKVVGEYLKVYGEA